MSSQILASRQTCTWRCRSQQHVRQLASAITKSAASIDDEQMKIYLASTCPAGLRSIDTLGGRSLLHWAASCNDRNELLEWLLDDFGGDIDSKDAESGYTPLHRALLHGQLASAQVLIDRDAQLNVFDHEGLTPLDIVRRDQEAGGFSLTGPTEAYSCGENATSNLGHRVPTERTVPELVDYFSRRSISVEKVAMSKWHTAFLTVDGAVYTCGHGSFGRLGHGDSNDRTVPTRVPIPNNENCRSVAVGDEHTIIITANGTAWAWGGNRRRQLGLTMTTDLSTTPQLVLLNKNVRDQKFRGCACGDWYTILWTSESVYGCGANEGQFGPCASKNDTNVWPLRPIVGVGAPFVGNDLLDIACGDTAVAILTSAKHDVFLLRNYECRRILSRILDLTRVVMNSSGSKKSEHQHHLHYQHQQQQQHQTMSQPSWIRLTFFSTGGNVYYWDTKDQQLRRCLFNGGGVTKMIYPRSGCSFGIDGLFVITDDGKIYKGRIKESANSKKAGGGDESAKTKSTNVVADRKSFSTHDDEKSNSRKSSASHHASSWTSSTKASASEETGGYFAFRKTGQFLDANECQSINLSHSIQATHRAAAVSAASDGRNFCVIQQNPKTDLTELPTKTPGTMSQDYETFLDEANADDCLHDIQIKTSEIGAQYRAAHKYILCSRCPYFSKRIQQSTTHLQIDEPGHIVNESALNRILIYIYTNDCDLFYPGSLSTDRQNENDGSDAASWEPVEKSISKRDPVRELLEASKRLNIKALTKRLEHMRWDASTKTVVQISRPQHLLRLRYEPNAFPELCDVVLRCKNKNEISAHRCVLSSRSAYFRCMFASGWWSETGRHQTLNVDLESGILTPVLHYLYTDELPPMIAGDDEAILGKKGEDAYATADKDTLEHYGRILVCADQWLLDRLRQLCEIELAARITLRNAADIMEFARTVNADQLFDSCSQFISLNLCSLLEANAFRNSSSDCLRRVGAYYRNFYAHVGHRAVTPFCQPPDVGEIESLWTDVLNSGVSPEDILQEYAGAWAQFQALGDSPTATGGGASGSAKKKRPSATVTPRARRTSASSTAVLASTENTPSLEKKKPNFGETIIQTTRTTISKPVPEIPMQEQKVEWRKSAKAKTETDTTGKKGESSQPIAVPSAGQLPSRSRNKPWNVALSPTEHFPEVSLRDLMQAEQEKAASAVSERRKSSAAAAVVTRQASSPNEHKSPPMAWAVRTPPPFIASVNSAVSSVSPQQQQQIGSTKKKNDGQDQHREKRGFNEIVDEEKSKEAARTRILNKPLKIIQIEELAMQELTLIYQIDDNWDELVTVERAVACFSEPTWQAHVGSPPRF